MKKVLVVLLSLSIMFMSVNPYAAAYAESDQPSSWAMENISQLRETGLFSDSRFTNFDKPITRVDFIYFLVRSYEIMTGSEVKIDYSLNFKDTKDEYALKALTVGLTEGTSKGYFSPYDTLDRKTMVVFVIKLLQKGEIPLNPASKDKFNDDSKIASWAKDYIMISKSNNIVNGESNGNFNPDEIATRQIAMILTNRILKESVGKNYMINGVAKLIELKLPKSVINTPPPLKLNEFGRIDFNFKEDDISTPAGKKAFEEKYHLGGYAKAEEIPTYYDLFNVSPFLSSPKSSNTPTCQWTKEELNYYLSNPPTLIGQDGSKPPFDKGIDALMQWIVANDDWAHVRITQPSIRGNSYLRGQVNITGIDFFELIDNSNNPDVLLEYNAEIRTSSDSPLANVYLKMILRNYVGEKYVDEAYKVATFEPAKFKSVYAFGDVEFYFSEILSSYSKRIKIGERGFKNSEYMAVLNYDLNVLLKKVATKPSFYDKYTENLTGNSPENYKSPNFIVWN